MSLFESTTELAVRHLSRERVAALRGHYRRIRTKLSPVLKALFGTFDVGQLRQHLEQRIGKDFEILMVHSSINRMKPMYTDGPLELVRMLIDYCAPDRTLVMPTFYFGDPAIGGAYQTFSQRSRFDLARMPSQMGLATELFRRTKGTLHSRHPMYRVSALGPLAKELAAGHEFAERPCGRGTPFDFMASRNTMIIGIGKPIEVLTQVHHAEDVLGESFPVPRTSGSSIQVTLVDGDQEIAHNLSGHGFAWKRNMWKLREIMDGRLLREWNFHHVPMFATMARDVTASLSRAAERGITLYEKP